MRQLLTVLFIFLNVSFCGGNESIVRTCSEVFAVNSESIRTPLIQYGAQASGFILGSINDIVFTISHGTLAVLAPDVAKWLPLFNEMANVASTATGKSWIYSGLQKKIIDGIALGAIGGAAMTAGLEHGVMSGALNFAVNMGLTYWFPNKYFHPMMEGIPKVLPKSLQKFASSSGGKAVIGISMILILEQVLEHAQKLVEMIPSLISSTKNSKRNLANTLVRTRTPVTLEHAIALFILDSTISEDFSENQRAQELLYIAGVDSDGRLFSNSSAIRRPTKHCGYEQCRNILKKLQSASMASLLTQQEIESVQGRL